MTILSSSITFRQAVFLFATIWHAQHYSYYAFSFSSSGTINHRNDNGFQRRRQQQQQRQRRPQQQHHPQHHHQQQLGINTIQLAAADTTTTTTPISTINPQLQPPSTATTTPPPIIPSTKPIIDDDDNDKEPPNSTTSTTYQDPFTFICKLAVSCMYQSDVVKNAGGIGDGDTTSSGNMWIDERSSFILTKAMDRITLPLAQERTATDSGGSGSNRDEASTWIRWMRSAPTPMIVDLTDDFRTVANETLREMTGTTIDDNDVLHRLGCRLILLPSGTTLSAPLVEPPVSFILGKLLYGGVTRYRSLESSNGNRNRPPRRTGEVTEIKGLVGDNPRGWMQYGGAKRLYESVDMGPAAVLEVVMVPIRYVVPRGGGDGMDGGGDDKGSGSGSVGNMAINRIPWKPQKMFGFLPNDDDDKSKKDDSDKLLDDLLLQGGDSPMALSGRERNEAFTSNFRSSVGGLSTQIESIVRRVLDGRIIRPADPDDVTPYDPTARSTTTDDDQSPSTTASPNDLAIAALESEELALLGLTPVRGLLLYGPPGCGKTALAREISRALRARSPKILSAPELLDRWVGGSERLVRDLFVDAEAELAACNGDASLSALHVVVIDEIDAVFRKRSGSADDSGEATRSSVVNQILAKLDGIDAIPNVLMIGMTNRRELLDAALLRPGRLEVQIEIPLPDVAGRREILKIHFDALRERGRLSRPLCRAIDGVSSIGHEKDGETMDASNKPDEDAAGENDVAITTGRKRRVVKRTIAKLMHALPGNPVAYAYYDLAANYATREFSGADIAGLVRCAGSIALSRARRDGGGVEGLLITLEDVKQALVEVQR